MNVEERLLRRSPDDIVYVGGIIQGIMKTEFWKVLQMMSSGLKVEEIEKAKNGIGNPISSDRILGRIEAYETLITNLEAIALQKEELSKPLKKTDEASEVSGEVIQTEELYEPSLNYGGAV